MHPTRHRSLIALAAAIGLAACGPKDKDGLAGAQRTAGILSESPTEDGLTEQKVDLDGDKVADVSNFWKERSDGPRQLMRKDSDLNRDGKVDVRTWFDNAGQIEKEEMDGDFDGRVDWADHYRGGKRVLTEVDTDHDGAYDLFKVYEEGKVRRKERDTNGDGRLDFWEYLDEAGKVVKVGRDVDGDGVMDIRED